MIAFAKIVIANKELVIEMKIVFLDIDGVLNFGGCTERAPSGCIGILDDKLILLKRIIDETNAKIVLVSTWKFGWEKDNKNDMVLDCVYMAEKFAQHGLYIYDKTYDRGFNRGQGITEYLFNTEDVVESWIVIDDEVFVDYEENGVMDRLIKTCFGNDGLLEHHVEEAIKKLNA